MKKYLKDKKKIVYICILIWYNFSNMGEECFASHIKGEVHWKKLLF